MVDTVDEAQRIAKKYRLDESQILNRKAEAFSLLSAAKDARFNIILHTHHEVVPEGLFKDCAKYCCVVDFSLNARSNLEALGLLPGGAVWATANLRDVCDIEEKQVPSVLQL